MKFNNYIPFLAMIFLQGCIFYSEDDFVKIPKIDSHVHINSYDGIFEGIAAADNFILITLNVDHGDSVDLRKQYDYAIISVQKHPGRVFFGATFIFDTAGWGTEEWSLRTIEQLDKVLSSPGAVSVKIWKNIGMMLRDRTGKFIMIDDSGLDPVINFIKEKGFPVTGHIGDPRNYWLSPEEITIKSESDFLVSNPQYYMYLHPEYPSYEDQINALGKFLEKNPDLTFIGCHLGSLEWSVDSLAKMLDKFPNMTVDVSSRIYYLQYQTLTNRKKIRDFCIKYQDRLLYGTNTVYTGSDDPETFRKRMQETWFNDWKFFTSSLMMTSERFNGKFAGLKLPRKVVDKIYYGNAVKCYKLKI